MVWLLPNRLLILSKLLASIFSLRICLHAIRWVNHHQAPWLKDGPNWKKSFAGQNQNKEQLIKVKRKLFYQWPISVTIIQRKRERQKWWRCIVIHFECISFELEVVCFVAHYRWDLVLCTEYRRWSNRALKGIRCNWALSFSVKKESVKEEATS